MHGGLSPDTQVGTAGVIAPRRQHAAAVGPDVPRPRLGDVQGAVLVQADPGVTLQVQGGPILLPHKPSTGGAPSREQVSWASSGWAQLRTGLHPQSSQAWKGTALEAQPSFWGCWLEVTCTPNSCKCGSVGQKPLLSVEHRGSGPGVPSELAR